MIAISWHAIFGMLVLLLPSFAHAQATHPEGRHETVIAGDYFGAGGNLIPESAVTGDAFVMGGQVMLHAPVAGDAVLTGGSVVVSAPVGGDLYATGGRLLIEANVAGNARIAGHEVEVTRPSRIHGKATIAARSVKVSGRVGPQLSIAAYSVMIDGEVTGNVSVAARELVVGPSARISGKLTWRGPGEPRVESGAVISGGVSHVDSALDDAMAPSSRMAVWALAIAFTFGLLLLGIAAIVSAPLLTSRVARLVRTRQFACLGLGLATILLVPFAIMVLALTVVGIPIAFVLALFFPLVLVFGYLTGVLSITDAIAGSSRAKLPGNGVRALVLALGLAGMLAFCTVPIIGWAMGALLTVAGVGAIVLNVLAERFPARVSNVELRTEDEVVFRREPTLRF